jgi:predicted dehydrogenase
MTDWGVHLLDVALWAMGEEKPPRRVSATVDQFALTDELSTTDQVNSTRELVGYTMTFETSCNSPLGPYGRCNTGDAISGTLGTLLLDRSGYNRPYDNG